MSKAEKTWSFTYNADGLRTQKTNGTTTYNYTYNGSSLSQMTVGSDTLRFFYDANGVPVSVDYNGTTYYYATNVQGDVMAILDANGTEVARYVYDAWGRNLAAFGTLQDTLGTHNPLRYRGYVYDVELKLYYLQSRYYNPYTCRFLNTEPNITYGEFDYSSGIFGYNLFTYCANNPVIFKDISGEGIILTCTLIFCGIGILGGGHHAAKASKAELGYVDGWRVAGGMVIGGAVGAAYGWCVGSLFNIYTAPTVTKLSSSVVGVSIIPQGPVLYSSWQAAEQSIRTLYNGLVQVFNTPYGNRIVDSFSKNSNILREVKYGYQGLSSFIAKEVLKDAYLIKEGFYVEWHFFWSAVSNTGGPSGPLRRLLEFYGIKIIEHF